MMVASGHTIVSPVYVPLYGTHTVQCDFNTYTLVVRYIDAGDHTPDDAARLVQTLNQDELPPQYRTNGACPKLDLTGESLAAPRPKPNPDSAVNAKPLFSFIGAFVLLVLLTFV